jgi:hypothetical protein
MAWGYGGSPIGDPQGLASEGGREDFYLGDDVQDFTYGQSDEFGTRAWHGESETYPTAQAFVEGEGLLDEEGIPHQGDWRSTYSNPVTEAIAENPLTNIFTDARGILRQGGGPGWADVAVLGLSLTNPATARFAGQAARAAKEGAQNWGQRQFRNVDWRVGNPTSYASDATWKVNVVRQGLLNQRRQEQLRDVRKMSADDFYAMDKRMQDSRLKDANLSKRDIDTIHWVNEAREQHKAIAHLARKGGDEKLALETEARIVFVDDLIEKSMTYADYARLGLIPRGGAVSSPGLNYVLSSEAGKMALKPSGMSNMEWAKAIQGKTLAESREVARKINFPGPKGVD